MKSTFKILIAVNVLLLIGSAALFVKTKPYVPPATPLVDEIPPPVAPELLKPDFKILDARPAYMNYAQTVSKLKEWSHEAAEIVHVDTYGKSKGGHELYYLRICNDRTVAKKPCVLITACIHGNEPLASSTVMWWCGSLLNGYCKDPSIKKLIDEREIYFVPIVSPDSYPNNRFVEGVDPNRDFPSPSKPNHVSATPVAALQRLFLKINPSAVISGHTWGRVYLTPYGDKMEHSENKADYDRIVGQMCKLSGYRMMRACDMYGANGLNNPPIRAMGEGNYGLPIHGTEVDWYYRNKAFSIVMEFGTHQRIPTVTDTKTEFDKTWNAALLFIQEGPKVTIK